LPTLSHQQPEDTPLPVLVDIIRSKTSSIIDTNSFQQNMIVEITNAENMLVLIDQEQNSDAGRQKIDFIFRQHPNYKHLIQMEIRGYGEGRTQEQESKIFDIFYRGGNELIRNTQGTGIGLALVNELMLAQRGEVKIGRIDPGLAMLLSFQVKSS
jgi:two-component system phosphate regulon sensor histidine kinase PhoR